MLVPQATTKVLPKNIPNSPPHGWIEEHTRYGKPYSAGRRLRAMPMSSTLVSLRFTQRLWRAKTKLSSCMWERKKKGELLALGLHPKYPLKGPDNNPPHGCMRKGEAWKPVICRRLRARPIVSHLVSLRFTQPSLPDVKNQSVASPIESNTTVAGIGHRENGQRNLVNARTLKRNTRKGIARAVLCDCTLALDRCKALASQSDHHGMSDSEKIVE